MANKIKNLKRVCLAVGFACCVGITSAQMPVTSTNTFTVNKVIPDGDPNGLSDTQTLNFVPQQLFNLTDLQVTLQISGGLNGDYYGYLVHDGSFVVLLNRVGKTAGNPAGSPDGGMTITLSSGSPDVHDASAGGGVLSGTFDVDGRNIDPSLVLDTTARTTSLDSFIGDDPSGDWTLFLADVDYGEQGTLQNWGLVITAVPEPGTVSLLGLGACAWVAVRKWRRCRK